MLHARLDPASPVPVYHQLAEALRYQVATGVLQPGATLPPLRAAALRWGVNIHTVRHAYAALAAQGLVRTEGRGSVVLGTRDRAFRRADPVDRFLADTIERAHALGLGPSDLARRFATLAEPPGAGGDVTVYIVECTEIQATDLARQVEAAWDVRAVPWSLERPADPPDGIIVATYFHYNEVRTRWPERLAQVRFVAIRPDPALARRLAPLSKAGKRMRVLVCEREAPMAQNIAADLQAVLPRARYSIEPVVERTPGETLAATRGSPVLYAPRVWSALAPQRRADPRAFEIQYLIDRDDLARLGEQLTWAHRRTA